MNDQRFYNFLQRHILLMIGLSLIPGIAYIFLGWRSGVVLPALIWYGLMVLLSLFGWKLYKDFHLEEMSDEALKRWYKKLSFFFYVFFALWTLIFLLYCTKTEYNLHYIAIFTQIGASVVASTLLVSDKRLFYPVLLILMLPLIGYFFLIGQWYGYVLSTFSVIFLGVLLYSSESSYQLLQSNYYQAQHDVLTGLYNRRYFVAYMEKLMKRIRANDHFVYILLIDLDHFKTINDTLGHDMGDKVLKEVSERIKKCCAQTHVIARLGGDEFTIVSQEYDKTIDCQALASSFAEKILQEIKAPYYIDGHHLYLSASIGVNSISKKVYDVHRFIKEADIAMYEAKERGRDGVIFFNDDLSTRVEYHLEVERRLYFAIEHNEIVLRYQPQFDKNQQVIGCEVLVRWHDPEFGFVSPTEFVSIAEKTGLIIELGSYIIEEAFKTLRQWEDQGIILEQFSINISVRQFFHSSFAKEIKALVDRHLNNNLVKKVIFEVTETILIEDMHRIIDTMREINRVGISFSMDDFGTGYSSLGSLRQMPIEELKIDRSFVRRIGKHKSDELMITTILSMASIFKLKTVAEGVETEEQFQFLLRNSCDIFQGFYFSKPLSKEYFEHFYKQMERYKEIHTLTYEI